MITFKRTTVYGSFTTLSANLATVSGNVALKKSACVFSGHFLRSANVLSRMLVMTVSAYVAHKGAHEVKTLQALMHIQSHCKNKR